MSVCSESPIKNIPGISHEGSNIDSCSLSLCTYISQKGVHGNFREGFIFTFFASQEPFAKIKTAKFLLSTCTTSELRFNLAPSNYLSVLTATEACQ